LLPRWPLRALGQPRLNGVLQRKRVEVEMPQM
jgi:hypothetical protein